MSALGCETSRQARAPHPGEPTLTVLTYNVNYGMAGDAETIEVIRGSGADLVALQETNEPWELALRAELSEVYPHMQFRHCCLAGGLGLLSKGPIEELDYTLPSVDWFPASRSLVTTRLGPVQVLNVHLRPQVSESGSVLSGVVTTPPIREAEMVAYHRLLQEGRLSLVVGDFNEDNDGRALEYLRSRGFVSALPEFEGDKRTWRWQTSLFKVTEQLDHIAYGQGFFALNAEVIEGGRSDHFAVRATLGPEEHRGVGSWAGSSLSF